MQRVSSLEENSVPPGFFRRYVVQECGSDRFPVSARILNRNFADRVIMSCKIQVRTLWCSGETCGGDVISMPDVYLLNIGTMKLLKPVPQTVQWPCEIDYADQGTM